MLSVSKHRAHERAKSKFDKNQSMFRAEFDELESELNSKVNAAAAEERKVNLEHGSLVQDRTRVEQAVLTAIRELSTVIVQRISSYNRGFANGGGRAPRPAPSTEEIEKRLGSAGEIISA